MTAGAMSLLSQAGLWVSHPKCRECLGGVGDNGMRMTELSGRGCLTNEAATNNTR